LLFAKDKGHKKTNLAHNDNVRARALGYSLERRESYSPKRMKKQRRTTASPYCQYSTRSYGKVSLHKQVQLLFDHPHHVVIKRICDIIINREKQHHHCY
jgi:hypothetical protein